MKEWPLAGPSFPFFHKGSFQILLLRALEDRPMHGYEIMKVLEDRFQGFYRPSAGAVYPALRGLLRRDLVSLSGEERRKTYRITSKGKAFLSARELEVEKRFRAFETAVGPERANLIKELRATGKLLGQNLRTISPSQAKELRRTVIEMRRRIMRILSE